MTRSKNGQGERGPVSAPRCQNGEDPRGEPAPERGDPEPKREDRLPPRDRDAPRRRAPDEERQPIEEPPRDRREEERSRERPLCSSTLRQRLVVAAVTTLVAVAVACQPGATTEDGASILGAEYEEPSVAASEPHRLAKTMLESAEGDLRGVVLFLERGGSTSVIADVRGLEPGKHGFHIHEQGDCNSPGFETAGGHFDPDGARHGGPTLSERHTGDLGNLLADEQGRAQLRLEAPEVSLDEASRYSILGRSVIVHAGEDDLESQPSGDAGPRIACGTIELVEVLNED